MSAYFSSVLLIGALITHSSLIFSVKGKNTIQYKLHKPETILEKRKMQYSYQMEAIETIQTERVDDIPLLVELLAKMKVATIIDQTIHPHGNRKGLSVGWMVVLWLSHILTEQNHRLERVQEWAGQHQQLLNRLSAQDVSELDFTDDRLADVLRYLSVDEDWLAIEHSLSEDSMRVYGLPTERIRLDATTATVHHDEAAHVLFKRGRSKAGPHETQFKAMLAGLDPLGMPLAVEVVPGNRADDPLYVPIYKRVKAMLGASGRLYVGDTKMGALATRAAIVAGDDYYLVPLARTGAVPALIETWLAPVGRGAQQLTPIYLPDDGQTALKERQIAVGFELSRAQSIEIAAQTLTWTERCLLARSASYAKTQTATLERNLEKAEAALLALTPPVGRGRRQIRDETVLRTRADAILQKYQLAGLLDYELEAQVSQRAVRAHGDRPARIETSVRYQLTLTRNPEALEQTKQRLGWRLYVTNSPAQNLSLNAAVLAYRGQYVVENIFSRLKGDRLSLTPLYLQRDNHALGLVRLLTIAVRLMALAEYSVRRTLAESGQALSGLHPGNPKRLNARPTSERLLRAFQNITLTFIQLPDQLICHLSPLSPLQNQILALLGLDADLYTRLTVRTLA